MIKQAKAKPVPIDWVVNGRRYYFIPNPDGNQETKTCETDVYNTKKVKAEKMFAGRSATNLK